MSEFNLTGTDTLSISTVDKFITISWDWISVKDQSPPLDKEFLAFFDGKIVSAVWCRDSDQFIPNCDCNGYDHWRIDVKPTHWMPLPKPPRENESMD